MTQELRELAATIRPIGGNCEKAAIAILTLLDRLEKAEKDAERWRNLCDLVNEERASVTFYGRVNTINSGLEVHDSGDLHDELDIAMEASK